MAGRNQPAPFDGLVVVDKPSGWTSHDVVGKLRRLIGTRRVGHAGTLDPMATGVLICGVGKATKLLGMISSSHKSYLATIRLGVATSTDDAEGEVITTADARELFTTDLAAMRTSMLALTGPIMQRPSSVSAIKIDGQRAYKRVRDGEDIVIAERPVTVSKFELLAARLVSPTENGGAICYVDVDVDVTCSTGTYVRALARDLGDDLHVGGHLTALRRTSIGSYDIADAKTLDELAESMVSIPLSAACRSLFVPWELDAVDADSYRHGRRLPWPKNLPARTDIVVFDPTGLLLGLATESDGKLAPTVVWEPA